jgi:curved DNA-binding protein CbpA
MQVVNRAYQILKNPMHRFEYDKSLRIIEKNNETKKFEFSEIKKSALEFLNTQKIEATNDLKFQEAQKKYLFEFNEANRKMGYIPPIQHTEVNPELLKQQYSQFMQLREQEDIENLPSKKFDQTPDHKTFNDAFDKLVDHNKSLIKYTGEILPFDANTSGCNISNEQFGNENMDGNNLDTFIITPKVDFIQQQKSIDKLVEERNEETNQLSKLKCDEFQKNEVIGMDGKIIKYT